MTDYRAQNNFSQLDNSQIARLFCCLPNVGIAIGTQRHEPSGRFEAICERIVFCLKFRFADLTPSIRERIVRSSDLTDHMRRTTCVPIGVDVRAYEGGPTFTVCPANDLIVHVLWNSDW